MNAKIELGDGTEIKINSESVKANNMKLCHSHQYYELYFLTDGERYLYAENRFYIMRRGDIFLMPPGLMHRTLDLGGGYSKFVVMLPRSVVPRYSEPAFRLVRPEGELARELLQAAETVCEGGEECFFAVMKMLSAAVTLPLCSEETVPSPAIGRVGEILNYLDGHYTEKISLTDLSERFYISEYYLCRLFKEYTGGTLNEYVARLRVERAKLLLSSGVSIGKAWRASGFGSESSFFRVFRESVGCTALEWKNRK